MTAGQTTMTIVDGDKMELEGICDGAGDEYVFAEKDITDISSDTYPVCKVRWKTSASSNGLGLRAQIVFGDASTQNIVGATNPEFSTTYTVTTGTITAGKTIDKIRILGDDYPDSLAAGTFQVYCDFFFIHVGAFTLPNTAHGMDMDFPPREDILRRWNRDVDVIESGGSESALINIGCDLDQGTWTRTGDTIDGEVFLDIQHNRSGEPWQWLNTEVGHQFKVTVHPKFRWVNNGDRSTSRVLDLVLKEYSLNSKSGETHAERYGI